MKKRISLVLAFAAIIGIGGFQLEATNKGNVVNTAQQEVQTGFTVDKVVHDFGEIQEKNGNVDAVFTLKNNSKEALLINRVSATCGCTVPEWPKEPIAPGKTASIKVTYNPSGRVAPFNKAVTINTTGTPSRIVVRIKGVVVK